MELREVQEIFFKYEAAKSDYIQEIQRFFLEREMNPYLWVDEKHRLHIKVKGRRGVSLPEEFSEKAKNIFEELLAREPLEEVWTAITTDIDPKLPEERQVQTSIECIFRIRR
jgi:hypothetical protein